MTQIDASISSSLYLIKLATACKNVLNSVMKGTPRLNVVLLNVYIKINKALSFGRKARDADDRVCIPCFSGQLVLL